MDTARFLELLSGIRLSGAHRQFIKAVKDGKVKAIGYDLGSPAGDKGSTIYGTVGDGRIIIDDVTYE